MRTYKKLILLSIIAAFGGPAWADEPGDQRHDAAGARAALAPRTPGIEAVEGERLAEAVGHYARARSLLLAAIREFDTGKKIATPDAILDSAEWRSSLIDRATELERILDPQPKITRGGVRFNPDPRLLGEAKR